MRDGNAPELARWVHDGSHRLVRWETDWSSQTGACQAGLLHGDNDDMPAFRWWEKDHGKPIVTNHPRDAAELERRHSDGRGLLHADGASRANILSGDAPHTLLTMSTVLDRDRPGRLGAGLLRLLRQPLQRRAHARARDRARSSPSAGRRDPAAPPGRRARGSSAAAVRAHAGVGDDHPARPAGRARHRRHATPAGRSPTRRSSPTTRSPTTRASSAPTRSRRCGASTAQIDADRRRASSDAPRPVPARRALRPRPVAGRDVPATATAMTLEELVAPRRRAEVRGRDGARRRGARLPRRRR